MQALQPSTSISAQQPTIITDIATPQNYKVRKGAIDFGRDYELRITALIALRCISPEMQEAGLAFNLDDCSDFDDLVVYKRTKNSDSPHVSLVQLKHQLHPKYIQSEDFFKEKGNFSLRKYWNSLDQVVTSDFQVLKEIFNDNGIGEGNVELVLYTNRDVDLGPKPSACRFLELYQENHLLKTNGGSNIYTINVDHGQMEEYSKDFLGKLLIFVRQVDVSSVNHLILDEIQKIVPNISANVVETFVQFITSWAKGELGGFHVLTRTRIIHELATLLLDPYIKNFIALSDEVTTVKPDSRFDQIIKNFDIALVSNFSNCTINYLRSYLNDSVQKYSNLQEKFCLLKYQISKNNSADGSIEFGRVHKALWQLGQMPLVFVVNSDEDYQSVFLILTRLRSDRKFVILSRYVNLSITLLFDSFKILCNLSDLDEQTCDLILDEEVRFENTKSISLRLVIDLVDCKRAITTNEIISVLNGTVCGKDLMPLLARKLHFFARLQKFF